MVTRHKTCLGDWTARNMDIFWLWLCKGLTMSFDKYTKNRIASDGQSNRGMSIRKPFELWFELIVSPLT